LVKVCKRGLLPSRYRKHLWLKASGASAIINLPENIGYYKKLVKIGLDYPNPSGNQIELDLNRTFSELEMEGHKENV
jgi:hypothetical protein